MVDIDCVNMEELFNDLRTCLFDLESDLTELAKDNTTKSEVLLRAREVYAGSLDMIDYMKEIQKTIRASYKIKEADVRKYMLESDAGYDVKECSAEVRADNLEAPKDIIADKFASLTTDMARPSVNKKVSIRRVDTNVNSEATDTNAPVEKKKISKKVDKVKPSVVPNADSA